MASFTKHLSTHVYFHMERGGNAKKASSPGTSSGFASYDKPRKKDNARTPRSELEPFRELEYPRYESTGGASTSHREWDDFDYFCQSPFMLSPDTGPKERPKKKLFRRSKDKYEPRSDEDDFQHSRTPSTRTPHLGYGPRFSETAIGEPRDGSWRRQQSVVAHTSRRSPNLTRSNTIAAGADDGAVGGGPLELPQEKQYQNGAQDCFIISARMMGRFMPFRQMTNPGFGGSAKMGDKLTTIAEGKEYSASCFDTKYIIHNVTKAPKHGLIKDSSSSSQSSMGGAVEIVDPNICIVIDFCENSCFTCRDLPSPTTELAPMPRDWISMQLGRQRQAFAWLRDTQAASEGLLLMNVERNSQFPFITYLVCNTSQSDPTRLIMQMEDHHVSGGERLHHTAGYEEVATIARPPVDMLPKKPTTNKTGYIISCFRVFPGEDREKLDRSWLLWTGARQIYKRLPKHLGLRRITFHKKICPDQGITYVLLCECPTLMDYVPEACVLVDQLRARCCGYTALYRVVDAF